MPNNNEKTETKKYDFQKNTENDTAFLFVGNKADISELYKSARQLGGDVMLHHNGTGLNVYMHNTETANKLISDVSKRLSSVSYERLYEESQKSADSKGGKQY